MCLSLEVQKPVASKAFIGASAAGLFAICDKLARVSNYEASERPLVRKSLLREMQESLRDSFVVKMSLDVLVLKLYTLYKPGFESLDAGGTPTHGVAEGRD